jgi:hypothetical protein
MMGRVEMMRPEAGRNGHLALPSAGVGDQLLQRGQDRMASTYSADGTLEHKVANYAGEQHGPGYWYDKSGAVELRGIWNHGKEFGRFTWYRPNGTIKAADFHDFYGKVFCKADYQMPPSPQGLAGAMGLFLLISTQYVNVRPMPQPMSLS